MIEVLVTEADLAQTVKLTRGALRQRRYEARKRGEDPDLPPLLRIGNRCLYRESDVRAWLDSKREGRQLEAVG